MLDTNYKQHTFGFDALYPGLLGLQELQMARGLGQTMTHAGSAGQRRTVKAVKQLVHVLTKLGDGSCIFCK